MPDIDMDILTSARKILMMMADGTIIDRNNRLPVSLETEITSIPVGDVWVGVEEGTIL